MKKRMLAVMEKGWIQGAQFLALFEDDLYFKMGRQANEMAARLQKGLKAKGWKLWVESPTNQVFVIAPNDKKPVLDEVCQYEDWCPYDEDHTVVRFVCCFHTTEAENACGLLATGVFYGVVQFTSHPFLRFQSSLWPNNNSSGQLHW